jgi:phage gp46-like protein
LHSKLLVYQRVGDFNSIPIVESAERNQALRWIVKAGNAKILDSSMVEPGKLKRS